MYISSTVINPVLVPGPSQCLAHWQCGGSAESGPWDSDGLCMLIPNIRLTCKVTQSLNPKP